MDPGLGGKDGAMTGRGFDASGNTNSSGIGPERALEAIIPAPRAQRESSPFPELLCGRRTDIKPKVRQRSGIGPERALEAINTYLRAQRECLAFPELLRGRRTDPAEPTPTRV